MEVAKNGGKFGIGDLLHVIEIVVLAISMGITYERFNQAREQVDIHTKQLNRIEHYLSSKDVNYWRLSKEDQ